MSQPIPPSPHLSEETLVLRTIADLPTSEQAAAEAHLQARDQCRDANARLVETLGLVDEAPPSEPPEGFERVMWARVQAKLPERRPVDGRRGSRRGGRSPPARWCWPPRRSWPADGRACR